jgi:hypothetical protein
VTIGDKLDLLMIINSALLILTVHLYYCLSGISSFGFSCRYQKKNRNREERKERRRDIVN